MGKRKSNFLEKALGRIDRLDSDGIHAVVGRLAQEHEFLANLLNSIHDGVLVVDATGRILYYNQAAILLLGLPEDDILGELVTRFVPGLDWPSIADADQRGLREPVLLKLEVAYPKERFLEVVATPIDGASVGSAGVTLIFHDETETRNKTFEAIESERVQALTLLAASVAHEIGNPLHALHLHLQLIERQVKLLEDLPNAEGDTPGGLSEGSDPIGKLRHYLSVAKGEITRLDMIVRDFLEAIRPVPPKLRLQDVNLVVRESLSVLQPELDNRGLRVVLQLSEEAAKALIDSGQLKQVLVNLVRNAMQAMTGDGILTIRTGDDDGGVSVVVEDTGEGIPEEELSRIFEPYYTTKERGTGLGLMIVHRIIDQHSGRIHVESKKGEGTRICLWLPRETKGPKLLESGAPSV